LDDSIVVVTESLREIVIEHVEACCDADQVTDLGCGTRSRLMAPLSIALLAGCV